MARISLTSAASFRSPARLHVLTDPGQHLVEVHDMFRRELAELRDLLARVREGAMSCRRRTVGL